MFIEKIIKKETEEQKKFFEGRNGERWVEDEYQYQGRVVNEIMARLIIDFIKSRYKNKKRIRVLSPTANNGRVESDMARIFENSDIKAEFVLGDVIKNVGSAVNLENLWNVSLVQLDAWRLPFGDNTFDVLFEKKGFLLQLMNQFFENEGNRMLENTTKAVLKLLEEYFRVMKPDGMLLIDAISDDFAYFPVDYKWDKDNRERRSGKDGLIRREKEKRLMELKRDGRWEKIQKEYLKNGLGRKDTLLQKSSSTFTTLLFLMEKDSKFARQINDKYKFRFLGDGIRFLMAILER